MVINMTRLWFQVSKIVFSSSYLGNWSNLTNICLKWLIRPQATWRHHGFKVLNQKLRSGPLRTVIGDRFLVAQKFSGQSIAAKKDGFYCWWLRTPARKPPEIHTTSYKPVKNSLSQWLNFKLFGITYLVGKIKFKLFFSGSIGWVRECFGFSISTGDQAILPIPKTNSNSAPWK